MKLALVTGGFRRVGAAIAERLAEQGYALAIHGRAGAEPDPSLIEALERRGGQWHAFHADLRLGEEVEALLPAVERHFGAPPDVLVNNAALFSEDDWRSVTTGSLVDHYALNAAAGTMLACRLAARLGEERRAVAINILDQRIANPHGDQIAYTISKQAAAGATRTLARALAPKVRVCGVAPGLTLPTPEYDEGQLRRLARLMPLQRLPSPDDVAEAVLYLIRAEATTGQVIFVDGGAGLESFDRDFVRLGRDGEGGKP